MNESPVEKHVEALQRELRARVWSTARVDAAWNALTRRHGAERSRRGARIGAGVLAAAAAVALALIGLRVFGPDAPRPASPTAASESGVERIELGADTEARLERGARLDTLERSGERVVVALRAGTARFHVRHEPGRLFRVEVGDVAVEDLGTVFVVEHVGSSARVAVTEGSVAVTFSEAGRPRRITLESGQTGVYAFSTPKAEARELAAPPADAAVPLATEPPGAASATPQPSTDWRELARAGKHRRAYELLAPTGFREVRDDAGDLLLGSDVARLSRHPAESVTLLRKLIARHERDPRAPSAAFTLGWLLMNELGRPREAAAAFAKAEALAPRGNLAEDAVARSVEAWHRAGEEARAKAEVERYGKLYPQGRHRAMLQRLIGMP
jgi:transmembrane sensor